MKSPAAPRDRSAVVRAGPGVRPGRRSADASVGTLLATARRQRKLSRAGAAVALNIPPRHIAALEEGDLSVFPAEVYARGAFTKYARWLGVHASPTDHAFMRLLSGAREFVPLRVHTPRPWLATVFTPRLVVAAWLLIPALALTGYLTWQVNSFFRLPPLTVTEPRAGVVATLSIIVSGQTAPEATVAINEQTVVVAPDGSFTLPLSLHPGINAVRVVATNTAGRSRTVARDILVPRH